MLTKSVANAKSRTSAECQAAVPSRRQGRWRWELRSILLQPSLWSENITVTPVGIESVDRDSGKEDGLSGFDVDGVHDFAIG